MFNRELKEQLLAAQQRIEALEAEKQKLLDRILEMSGQKALYASPAPTPACNMTPLLLAELDASPIPIPAGPALTMDAGNKPKAEPEQEVRSLDALTVINRAMSHRNKRNGLRTTC